MGLGRILNQIEMVAPTEASALISGESGINRLPIFALFFSKQIQNHTNKRRFCLQLFGG
jgi:hypothetical protein